MIRRDERRDQNRHDNTPRAALTDPQWSIYETGWDQTTRFRVAVCGRRFGKALALDTRLPSPSGWTTMGEVRQGDALFDELGRPCRVVLTTDVRLGRTCKRLRFDDGCSVIADEDHVWSVHLGAKHVLLTTMELASKLKDSAEIRVQACRALQMPPEPLREAPFRSGLLGHLHGTLGLGRGGVRGSVRQRRALLHGFLKRMDAELTVARGRVQLRGTELARELSELLRSLGYVPFSDGGQVVWGVQSHTTSRLLTDVQQVQSVPVRCIQVNSPSQLYLCSEGMIPTHNTFLMAEEIRRAASLAVRRNVGIENEIWYGAPTFLQAKRVMWARLKRAVPEYWLDGRPNETSCALRLRSGHVIRIVGLDAPDNLRGSGLWFFGGDEWADCSPDAWAEVIRPMLSTSRGHALFIGTPKGFDHFRDAYVLGQPGGDPSYRSFLYTTMDGGNVSADEIAAAQRLLDPRTFRQEYGASFESYAGRVVYAFSRAESVRRRACDISRPIHVGMDFNINPMSATIWQEEGEVTWQVDEISLPTSNTDEMVTEIKRRFGRQGFDPSTRSVDHITIYPDPAGAQRRSSAAGRTDVGILRGAGFRVIAMSSHPPIRDRNNMLNRVFMSADGKRHAFVDPGCVKSIESYERLVYRDGSSEPDKSRGHDHLVDASGYYLFGRNARNALVTGATSHIMER